ncbi:MAG: Arm DNA-binding domain-containing protein, partial [Desulfovibrio sp.]|nr:Arm DNA-binding domain-containing protein [Desulfovibrio sp.]
MEVRKAKPDAAKRYTLFDTGGLYLEVSPEGHKWWRLKYTFEGKVKRKSLGVYPDISLKDARERRDEARTQIAKGIDPFAKKENAKTLLDVYRLYEKTMMSHYSENTIRVKKMYLEKVILSTCPNKNIADVSSDDFYSIISEYSNTGRYSARDLL